MIAPCFCGSGPQRYGGHAPSSGGIPTGHAQTLVLAISSFRFRHAERQSVPVAFEETWGRPSFP